MKSRPLFEVEQLVKLSDGKVLVLARHLDNEDFCVVNGLTLGDAPIRGGDIPRAVDAEGKQRFALWGFWLKDASDIKLFEVGQRVELSQ